MNKIALPIMIGLLLLCHFYTAVGQTNVTEVIVSPDGSGQFTTIQEAVNAFPDWSATPLKILVKPGIYNEKLVIPINKMNIQLIGADKEQTIIRNADHNGKPYPGRDATGKTSYHTYTTYTVLVQGNDFRAENITIENAAGAVGQAVALHIEADRCVIKNCKLLGNQDTLFLAKDNSRQYFEGCFINGTTDFIFGASTAVFNRCEIFSKRSSYVTAANTPQFKKWGLLFVNCTLTADTSTHNVLLGRPWRGWAYTAFINCYMGNHIAPIGWNNWNKPQNELTARYYEYNNYGPGAQTDKRAKWMHQLTKKEARKITFKNVFGDWQPAETVGKKLISSR